MKKLAVFIVVIMFLNITLSSLAVAVMTKGGVLTTSEVWSGEIELKSDVTIPAEMELKIEPGTLLTYDDKAWSGKTAPEFIVNGTLKVGEEPIQGATLKAVPLNSTTRVIKITPYEVDTKSLRDEFREFKIQYAIIWTLLGVALIYTVAHR